MKIRSLSSVGPNGCSRPFGTHRYHRVLLCIASRRPNWTASPTRISLWAGPYARFIKILFFRINCFFFGACSFVQIFCCTLFSTVSL